MSEKEREKNDKERGAGKRKMCYRKVFIHHRCGHRITQLVEGCGNVECRAVSDRPVITNKYTCVVPGCLFYGRF